MSPHTYETLVRKLMGRMVSVVGNAWNGFARLTKGIGAHAKAAVLLVALGGMLLAGCDQMANTFSRAAGDTGPRAGETAPVSAIAAQTSTSAPPAPLRSTATPTLDSRHPNVLRLTPTPFDRALATPTATETIEPKQDAETTVQFDALSLEILKLIRNGPVTVKFKAAEFNSGTELKAMKDVADLLLRKIVSLALSQEGQGEGAQAGYEAYKGFFANGGMVLLHLNGSVVVSYDDGRTFEKKDPCCDIVVRPDKYFVSKVQPVGSHQSLTNSLTDVGLLLGSKVTTGVNKAIINSVPSNSGFVVFEWRGEQGKMKYMRLFFNSRYIQANSVDVSVRISEGNVGNLNPNEIIKLTDAAREVINAPKLLETRTVALSREMSLPPEIIEATLEYFIIEETKLGK